MLVAADSLRGLGDAASECCIPLRRHAAPGFAAHGDGSRATLTPVRDLPIGEPSNIASTGAGSPIIHAPHPQDASAPALSHDQIALGAQSGGGGGAIPPPEVQRTDRPFQFVDEICQRLTAEHFDLADHTWAPLRPYLPAQLLSAQCRSAAASGEAAQARMFAKLGPYLHIIPRAEQHDCIRAALNMRVPKNRADALSGLNQCLDRFSSAGRALCLDSSYAIQQPQIRSIALQAIAQSIHACSQAEQQQFILKIGQISRPKVCAQVLSCLAESFPHLAQLQQQSILHQLYLPLPEDAKAIAAKGLAPAAAYLDKEQVFLEPLRACTKDETRAMLIEHLAPSLGHFSFGHQEEVIVTALELESAQARESALYQLTTHAHLYEPQIQRALVELRLATPDALERTQALQGFGQSAHGFAADLQEIIKAAAFSIEDQELKGAIIAALAPSAFNFPPALRHEFMDIVTQWDDPYEKAFALRGLAHNPPGPSEEEQTLLLNQLTQVADMAQSPLAESDIHLTLQAFAPAMPQYSTNNVRRWLYLVRQHPLIDRIGIVAPLIPKTPHCSEQLFHLMLRDLFEAASYPPL